MKVISSIFVALTVFLLLGVSAKAAPEIYGVGSFTGRLIPCELCGETFENNQIIGFFGESSLYKLSSNSGIPQFIGFTGFAGCRGLDFHPETGELYAVCNPLEIPQGPPGMMLNAEEEGGQVLVHIDINTGEGTEIGPLGDGIGNLFRGGFVSDISFHSDGTLYAHLNASLIYRTLEPTDQSTSNGVLQNTLGIIDLQTGDFEPIGPTNSLDFLSAIGFTAFDELIQCANFDNLLKKEATQESRFDPLFHFTNVNSLDLASGNATFISQLVFPPEVEGHFNVVTSKDIDSETGAFFAFLTTEEIMNGKEPAIATNNLIPDGSYLVRINPDSTLEIIGQTSPPFEDFLGIAVKSKTTVVPTMSEYGLMLTVALFLGAAVVFLRRRQAKSEV